MKLNLPAFTDKSELIAYLVKNKEELIELKKSAIKYADSFGGFVTVPGTVGKSILDDRDTDEVIYRTLIGNTYNWMDSHDDVHLDNVFAVSIKQRQNKIYHRHDHIPQLTAKVGKFSQVYEQMVNWTDLGINKAGQTMVLLGDSAIRKSYNHLIFESYKDEEIDQHSVGMMYGKMSLAVNDPDYKEEFATWNKYISRVGNSDKAINKGYFWAHKEAKLIEISCVTEGSNELTGMYNPASASLKIDPLVSSQELTKIIKNAFSQN